MIEIFFAPTPNCWKVTILLEELEEPYRITPVDLGEGGQFEPEFLAISPNNRVPAIIDHAPLLGEADADLQIGRPSCFIWRRNTDASCRWIRLIVSSASNG